MCASERREDEERTKRGSQPQKTVDGTERQDQGRQRKHAWRNEHKGEKMRGVKTQQEDGRKGGTSHRGRTCRQQAQQNRVRRERRSIMTTHKQKKARGKEEEKGRV